MLESDISYSYDTRGYMMMYKGKPIGGAGISREAKASRANLKLFRQSADATKREILSGRISEPMKRAIAKIDDELFIENT